MFLRKMFNKRNLNVQKNLILESKNIFYNQRNINLFFSQQQAWWNKASYIAGPNNVLQVT